MRFSSCSSSLLLCLVLFNYLVNVITGHFTTLIRKMDAFGEDETTLPQMTLTTSSRSDEIGELHRRFDKMAVHVQDLIQKTTSMSCWPRTPSSNFWKARSTHTSCTTRWILSTGAPKRWATRIFPRWSRPSARCCA
ncbi:MAG: hypothetical protein ACLUOA_07005 [Gemmiger formicilis]|uniref:HAMP domain-containing protein n=1 Tax=Gemmiger formicilis TaxID=745368 RepID=UPI0039925313